MRANNWLCSMIGNIIKGYFCGICGFYRKSKAFLPIFIIVHKKTLT